MKLSLRAHFVLGAVLLATAITVSARPPQDVVFVVDNSASMKTNDPKRLVPELIRQLSSKLRDGDRASVVVFDSAVVLALPLTQKSDESFAAGLDAALAKLDYGGRFTYSADAVERAMRELQDRGRSGVTHLLVFLTDGVIDTGDGARDREKRAWLTGPLLDDLKRRGVRVFGVTLGPKADFQLVQALAQGTGTGYGDIQDISQIGTRIEQLERALAEGLEAPPGPATPGVGKEVVVVQTGPGMGTILAVGLAVLLAVGFSIRIFARPAASSVAAASATAAATPGPVPGACLLVPPGVSRGDDSVVELRSQLVWVGQNAEGTALCLQNSQISANHFRIEYDPVARAFHIVDNSTNGTWVQPVAAGSHLIRLERGKPHRLCDSDRIVLPGLGQEKALEFRLTSKHAPDRPAGATRFASAVAYLKFGRSEFPVLSFTCAGFDANGAFVAEPGTPADHRFLIERLGEAGAERYVLSRQGGGVTWNGTALEVGETRDLSHGDKIALEKDGRTFELTFDFPTQFAGTGTEGPTPAAGVGAQPAAEAASASAATPVQPAESSAPDVPAGPKKTSFGRAVARPVSSFSDVDATGLRSAEDPRTRLKEQGVCCVNHQASDAVEVCCGCGKPLCAECAGKGTDGKVRCPSCAPART